jgi:hypothetical protein
MITQKASRLAYPFIAALALGLSLASYAADPAYFTKYESMQTTPETKGVLVVEMTTNSGLSLPARWRWPFKAQSVPMD